MNVLQCLGVALDALRVNKLRSALTMLGIIIGVAAVILLVSLGRGLEVYINDQFNSFGTNLIYIASVPPGENAQMDQHTDKALGARNALGISNADVEAIAALPDVASVAPGIEQWATVVRGNFDTTTTLFATTPETETMRNLPAVLGRFVTEEDVMSGTQVVVLGTSVAESLFQPDEYPIDQTIRIEGLPFRVVGVLEEKGGMMGQDMDDLVIVPLTTAQRRLYNMRRRDGEPEVAVVQVEVADKERVDDCVEAIEELLRERHGIIYRDADDFIVITQDEMLAALNQVLNGLTVFLGVIAGISLLVGGIGIMNIMLVSVTERTREIGLRKAVGARRRDILTQFLIEAVVLAVVGGVLGILLGSAGAMAIGSAVEDLIPFVSPDAVLMATSISALVGVTFGLYPAWRAARLNPIDALRYE